MSRALQLAALGRQDASPNPMVGAVIVCDDKIIGEGWHRRCGEGHAEVNAIASVKNPELLKRATLYVTLEPCSHYGKTPPCAKLIIDNKIPHVVVATVDPFEQVSGRGIEMLRQAGINVTVGVLEEEARRLNRRFFCAHTLKRPFITLKWARSADGYIDRKRALSSPPAKFSTPLSSVAVHRLRSLHDAILTTANTVIADNPTLNVRLWDGRQPIRAVIDRKGILTPDRSVFSDTGQRTLLFTSAPLVLPGVETIEIPSDCSFQAILQRLYAMGITSVLVEAGSTFLQHAIDNQLWDTARVETAALSLAHEGSVTAPRLPDNAREVSHIMLDGNQISCYLPPLK